MSASFPGRLFLAFLAHRHLTAADAFSILGRLSSAFLAPRYVKVQLRCALFPVLRLGRLYLAFSTCSTVNAFSYSPFV